jgi:SAM-dependent methyltransferase
MLADSMAPHGKALLAYFEGDRTAELIIRRDDGLESVVPASHFFRPPAEFSRLELAALGQCSGTILDAGAGTGLHTLALQERGLSVSAIDIDESAVKIMKYRGVLNAQCANIFGYEGKTIDTILLMGHAIGMVETLAGLDRFLPFARSLVAPGGQILLDTLDVRATGDPRHLAYQANNRLAGRYIGETRLQFEYRGVEGPWCGWLHVDAETLGEFADRAGWNCTVLEQIEGGEYVARLYLR